MASNPAKQILQFIPTPGKLKRMYAQARPTSFTVSGGIAIAVIGLLLCIIGIQAFSYSHSMAQKECQIGCTKAAVETCSHKAATPTACTKANCAPVQAGGFAQSASLFLVVIGLLIAFKPHIVYYELKRLGLVRQPQ